jgi:hypothetical protein
MPYTSGGRWTATADCKSCYCYEGLKHPSMVYLRMIELRGHVSDVPSRRHEPVVSCSDSEQHPDRQKKERSALASKVFAPSTCPTVDDQPKYWWSCVFDPICMGLILHRVAWSKTADQPMKGGFVTKESTCARQIFNADLGMTLNASIVCCTKLLSNKPTSTFRAQEQSLSLLRASGISKSGHPNQVHRQRTRNPYMIAV